MTVREKTTPAAPRSPTAPPALRPASHLTAPAREEARQGRERWQRAAREHRGAKPFWKDDFTTVSGMEVPPLVTADEVRSEPGARHRRARRVPVHARHPSHRLPRQAVDDAAVRRLRQRRRHQPALPLSAGAGPDRPLGRLRPADALRLRRRPRDVQGRGREVRRRGLLARRHGAAVRGHSAGRDLDLDDHQLDGADPVRDVPGGGGEAGRRLADPGARHAAERHPQGVHRAEGVHLPAAARRCA